MNNNPCKLIMVIAGSEWQIPIIKKIREMGHRSLTVNLYPDSPAFRYSDLYEVADILDKDKCLAIARRYGIDAVISEECDIAMPTVAYIADSLGLPALTPNMAHLYTDKSAMRAFCAAHNFPSPRYLKCTTEDEARDFITSLGGKAIIKPLDANSSRGVGIVEDIADLPCRFSDAMSFSRIDKAVLVEEYIEGPEFTVDGLMTRNGHQSLAVSIKKHYSFNPSIACELFFSHSNDKYDYDLLRRTNDSFVNESRLKPGCLTHAEYKFQKGKFHLIEIAARGGGNLISSDIVPLMSGIDNYSCLIHSALGDAEPVEVAMRPEARFVVLRFFDPPVHGGTVKSIEGLDMLASNPHIDRFKINFKPGDSISGVSNDSERVGFYIAHSDNEDQLRELIKEVTKIFRIIT